MIDVIENKMADYGKMCWLWASSPLHQQWNAVHQARTILPAIETEQYFILEDDGLPVAYCSWVFLSQEAEVQYILDCSSVPLEDWQSGNRMWFVDWVAPFKRKHTAQMSRVLSDRFPDKTAHGIRIYPEGGKNARVTSFSGSGLTPAEARRQHDQHHTELLQAMNMHSMRRHRPGKNTH